MTIPNENIENNYVGNGVATTFAYTFPIFEDADIVVTRADTDGVETVLTLGTDYTVTGAGLSAGGNVVLASALASNYLLNVTSNTAKTQTYDIRSNPTYRPDNMERALDRQVRMIQEVGRETDKAVRLAVTQTGVNPRLPLADAGKIIGWREDGTGLDNFSQVPEALVGSAMEAVMTASTLASARSLMGPWGDALVTATGGSAARSLANRFADEANVLDFGADRTGTADSAAAISAAYAALPASGGVLYFPPGTYRFNSTITFSRSIRLAIRGAGSSSSVLTPAFAAGNAMDFSNCPSLDIEDIGCEPIGDRNHGTWMFNVDGTNIYRIAVSHVRVIAGYGGIFRGDKGNFYHFNACHFVSWGNAHTDGDTCLRLSDNGETIITGCYMVNGNGASTFARGPVMHLGATATSAKITGNIFNGGGPRQRWGIRAINFYSTYFVVTLDGNTAGAFFQAGDYLVLRACMPSVYNNVWRIYSEDHSGTYSTITVLTTAPSGNATVLGKAEDLTACVVIDNDGNGSVNESNIVGNLFEASVLADYGSAGLYFDGRRSTRFLGGWLVGDNYYDFGDNGLVLSGKDADSTGTSVYGITVSGGVFESRTRCILIDQASGIAVSGVQGPAFETTTSGDGLNASGTGSVAIHVIAGTTGTSKSRGITISNSNLGMCRMWVDGGQTISGYDHGLVLDGSGIQDLLLTGCNLYGRSAGNAVKLDNSALAATSRWKMRDNQLKAGTVPWVAGDLVPSVASATTVTLPPGFDTIKITGTTTVTTVNGGWVGREVRLLFTGSCTFLGVSFTANQVGTALHDGTSWFVN